MHCWASVLSPSCINCILFICIYADLNVYLLILSWLLCWFCCLETTHIITHFGCFGEIYCVEIRDASVQFFHTDYDLTFFFLSFIKKKKSQLTFQSSRKDRLQNFRLNIKIIYKPLDFIAGLYLLCSLSNENALFDRFFFLFFWLKSLYIIII